MLIVYRLSRFARNAAEVLANHNELESAGIQLRSISEGIDFSTKYGKAFLGFLAILAELENEIRRETMLDGRIARQRQGKPTAGSLPIGRLWDDANNTWLVDEPIAENIRWAATEYLNDSNMSLHALTQKCKTVRGWQVSDTLLGRTFRERCDSEWVEQLPDQEPYVHTIPRILPDETVERLRTKIASMRHHTRTDVKIYPLSGFLKCEKCGFSVSGGYQSGPNGKKYYYYYHGDHRASKCKAFKTLPKEEMEEAIFRTVFENIHDQPSFNQAIKDSLPDQAYHDSLKAKVDAGNNLIKKIDTDISKLADAILQGIAIDTIKQREGELYTQRDLASKQLAKDMDLLKTLPDPAQVQGQADAIRRELILHYRSPEHLQEMSYDEKRNLLSWLFDGVDESGKSYGIYISVEGKGKDKLIDYFFYGKLMGLRTIKGTDINYTGHLANNENSNVGQYE